MFQKYFNTNFLNHLSIQVEVCDWETQLARIQNILETWMFVQEQWLCFEPILSTADIASKMETEGRLFKVRQEHKNIIYLFINANFSPFSNNIRINCIKCATNDSNGSETKKLCLPFIHVNRCNMQLLIAIYFALSAIQSNF